MLCIHKRLFSVLNSRLQVRGSHLASFVLSCDLVDQDKGVQSKAFSVHMLPATGTRLALPCRRWPEILKSLQEQLECVLWLRRLLLIWVRPWIGEFEGPGSCAYGHAPLEQCPSP